MSDRSRTVPIQLFAAACAALAPSAGAQCLGWESFPSTPSFDDLVGSAVAFDDGSGLALYVSNGLGYGPPVAWRVDGAQVTPIGTDVSGWSTELHVLGFGGPAQMYAVGRITLGDASPHLLVRWTGSAWASVGSAPTTGGYGYDALVHDDGGGARLYLAGAFSSVGGVATRSLGRWDGSAWTSIGGTSGPIDLLNELEIHDEGGGAQLYAFGEFTSIGGVPAAHAARWDGAAWHALGAGPGLPIRYAASFDDGTGPAIYVAHANSANSLQRWRSGAWTPITPPPATGQSVVRAMRVADDGSGPALYVTTRDTQVMRLWRWTSGTWTAVGDPFRGGCARVPLQSDTLLFPGALDLGSGPALYAAPGSGSVVHGSTSRLVRLDGTTWEPALPTNGSFDASSPVLDVLSFDDGSGPALYAAGSFCEVGGVEASCVARYRDGGWEGLDVPETNYIANPNEVRALAAGDLGAGPTLFAGGRFAVAPQQFGVARWNGSSWIGLGTGVGGGFDAVEALLVADIGAGPRLFAGGSFTTIGNVLSPNFASWDGTGWSAAGANGQVLALERYDSGSGPEVVLGGTFTAPSARVARWNGASFAALGSGMDGHVFALRAFDDGTGPKLYAAGAFTTAGGVAAQRVARWDGASWSAVGAGFDELVTDLEIFDDGSGPALHAAGNFAHSGATPIARIARWNGSAWQALGNGVAPSVSALAAHADADGTRSLYVGGTIQTAGVQATSNLAAWRGCTDVIERFCVGDGTSSACPCGNSGLASRGCNNSAGTGGARLNALGATNPDTISLHAAGETPSAATLVFQGDVLLTSPVPFGDGLRCVGGSLKRMYTASASNGSLTVPGPGQPSLSARSAQLGDVLTPGSVRGYQAWYRDVNASFCAPPQGANWNLSNALRIAW